MHQLLFVSEEAIVAGRKKFHQERSAGSGRRRVKGQKSACKDPNVSDKALNERLVDGPKLLLS